MKKFLVVGLIVLTVALISFLWLANSFTMFEVQEEILTSHSLPGKNFRIEIKRIAAGATTRDVIQVVKVYSDGASEMLKIMDGYSDIVSSSLVADSLLIFVVRDGGDVDNQPDTIEVVVE